MCCVHYNLVLVKYISKTSRNTAVEIMFKEHSVSVCPIVGPPTLGIYTTPHITNIFSSNYNMYSNRDFSVYFRSMIFYSGINIIASPENRYPPI